MKPSRRLLASIIPLFALSIFLSGCYTELATTRDDDQGTYTSKPERARVSEPQDTTATNQDSYYDDYDQWHGHNRVGFGYYYPSNWYWDFAFGDPYYYGSPYYGGMYGYPSYYGYWNRWNPYYSGYGYGYGYTPYGYYSGYPYVVYAGGGGGRNSQTRDSGYRRTGGTSRTGGYVGAYGGSTGSSLNLPPSSRRSGGQGSGSVAPANRRSESPSGRASRSYSSPSGSSGRSSAAPSRSAAPSVRSYPSSGGSRSPEGGTRTSGSSRSRGYSEAPASGYYRTEASSQRGSSAPSSSPRYSPAPSYSPPASSAPASSSPAPSSGGGDGGSRSSGATRSGRN
jgi:hypothetical protein